MKLKKVWNLFKHDIEKDLKYGVRHLERREQMAVVILGFVLLFAIFILLTTSGSCFTCGI